MDLKEQVNRSIELAHLELPKGERKSLFSDFGKILNFVEIIKKTEKKYRNIFGKNVTSQEREFPQLNKSNAVREDIIDPFSRNNELLSGIPSKKDNLIKVKKI